MVTKPRLESLIQYQTLLRESPDGVLIVGPDGEILFANPAATSAFGVGTGELLGTLFGVPVVGDILTEIELRSGRTMEMRVAPIPWQRQAAYLVLLRDVTDRVRALAELAQSNRQLEELALVDPLTGVLNRRGIEAELLEVVGLGPRFTETIPADIITRKATNSGDTVPYGLSYVFFAVCGGKIGPAPSGSTSALPLGCYDPVTNEPLGADDFVIGYTPVYSYDTLTNNNPVVTGGTFDGKPGMVKACKADTDCDPKERCGKLELCIPVVPHCTAKAVKDCQTYAIKPTLDQAKTVELDSAAPAIDGKTPEEFIWVAFYASDGSLEKGLSLVNDAQKGWNADYEGKWSAPNAKAGESRIWTVIHDNRGGTSWWWQDVYVD